MTGQPQRIPLMIGMGWFPDQAGGLNRYFRELRSALAEATETMPTAIVVGTASAIDDQVRVAGSHGRNLFGRMWSVTRLARAERPSFIDAHFALYAVLPAMLCRPRSLVVHFQGPWAAEAAVSRGHGRVRYWLRWKLETSLYRRADRVVVLSEAFGREVVERYGVDPAVVRRIAPGVDLDRFVPGDSSAARRTLGVEDDEFLVVCVRRLDARMGIDIAIAACAQAKRSIPRLRTLIAGDGPERDALAAEIARHGSDGSVQLLGRVSDEQLVTLYQAADLSIVPTRSLEGFGLIVLESLACGTPAIVTDIGGLPETVGALDASLVVAAEDVDELAARIIDAFEGSAPLPGRDECRAFAETFSWRRAADAHLDLYAELA